MSSLASIRTVSSEGVEVPSLIVNFGELQNRMDNFRSQFDEYLSSNKEKIVESKNEFNLTLSKNKETEKSLLAEIESLHQKDVENAKLRAKEQEELEETNRAIRDYSLKREQMTETQKTLEKQISELRQSILKMKESHSKIKQTIIQESSKNQPELELWESTLGVSIEGVSDDVIGFKFTNIDPNAADREFSCVMDLSERDYKVLSTSPALNGLIVDQALTSLNSSRKLSLFLRDIRKAFKDMV
ncbi:kinetochore protein Spc25 [Sugiyamaella lignohabitans]|uniref:Kinetochore protein SPC25 n=1 Tax=Sugiyamaella lignohabitans TaxID=796027 RepID=A0A161HMQ8_9ASCO|nr:kinetochore protein Spc25 [Sugiyamaella lignohabitans]ANB15157.1 kinetochore protein Spc25 [Sugiyamaella lignohabitans]